MNASAISCVCVLCALRAAQMCLSIETKWKIYNVRSCNIANNCNYNNNKHAPHAHARVHIHLTQINSDNNLEDWTILIDFSNSA